MASVKVLLDVRAFASRKESALVSGVSIFWEEEQKTINFLPSTSVRKLTRAVLISRGNCCVCVGMRVHVCLGAMKTLETCVYNQQSKSFTKKGWSLSQKKPRGCTNRAMLSATEFLFALRSLSLAFLIPSLDQPLRRSDSVDRVFILCQHS